MKKLLLLSLLSVMLFGSSFVASAQTSAGTSGTVVCITEPCPTTTPVTPSITTTTTPTNTYSLAISEITLCLQSAVKTREDGIQAAFSAYNTAMLTALTTRASALNVAWGNSDAKARKAASTTAWNAYGKSSRENNTVFRTAKNSGWRIYNTAVAACKKKAKDAKLAPLVLPLESANNDFKTI